MIWKRHGSHSVNCNIRDASIGVVSTHEIDLLRTNKRQLLDMLLWLDLLVNGTC